MPVDTDFKRPLIEQITKKMRTEGLTVSALARRMGTGRTAVRRILDRENTSITVRTMSLAARAVGLKIRLVAEPMPPAELGKLAGRLAKSKNKEEARELKRQIKAGFYLGS